MSDIITVMEMNFKLNQKYAELGFHISGFGEKSLALKHGDKTIFIFGANLDLKDDFINRLCDSYLALAANAVNIGIHL